MLPKCYRRAVVRCFIHLQATALLLFVSTIMGCTQQTDSPPADYESYTPPRGHWAVKLDSTEGVSETTIIDAIKKTDGIRDDSVLVNIESGWVSFRTEATDLAGGAPAKLAVIEVLSKLGVKVGESKIVN